MTSASAGMEPDPAPDRPARWFAPLTAAVVLVVAGVTAFAVYRHLTASGQPVLPSSWCRVGSVGALPPLLGSALLTRWTVDPIALAVLAAMLFWYLGAVLSRRRRTGTAWPLRRTLSFLAGSRSAPWRPTPASPSTTWPCSRPTWPDT